VTTKELLALKYGEDYTLATSPGYAHFEYSLTALSDKAKEMTVDEAMLLADGGNLCFGGRDGSRRGDVFTGIVHTD